VTQDDVLYRFVYGCFAIKGELGNVRASGRAMGITLHRPPLQAALDRHGLDEILRPA
jgi:hypothetical protein